MVILVFFRFGQSAFADVEFRSDKRFGKVTVVYAFNLYPQQFLGMSGYFDGKNLIASLVFNRAVFVEVTVDFGKALNFNLAFNTVDADNRPPNKSVLTFPSLFPV